MSRRKGSRDARQRVGRVSCYCHHGGWYVYYREEGRAVRRRVADTQDAALEVAAGINAQLSSSATTPFSFTPISIRDLRPCFLERPEHHERVLGSSRQNPEAAGRLSPEQRARIARAVWRDAGAILLERIRLSFLNTSRRCGVGKFGTPKSWRHTFATLLQDANVDPLIRQLTLGHKLANSSHGDLGMTGVYTHTRRETQKREIERALRLWPQSLDLTEGLFTWR